MADDRCPKCDALCDHETVCECPVWCLLNAHAPKQPLRLVGQTSFLDPPELGDGC